MNIIRGNKRPTPGSDQPSKVGDTAKGSKAGSKTKDKQKQSEDKAAKANT